MNKQVSATMIIVSLAVAAGGITASIKANNEKKGLQEEMDALRATMNTPEATAPAPEPTEEAPVVAMRDISQIDTNDVAVLLEELNLRNAELERLRAQLETNRNNRRQPGQSWQDRIAQMKEDDPERYAEMVQRRTDFQNRMRNDQFQRISTLSELDTSNMTPEELANHTALIEKLSAIWEKTGQFDPENPPDRDTMREVFGSMREVGQMMDQERTVMFKQLGSDVGLSGTDADHFASYVESVIDATSMRPPRGMRGGPRSSGGESNGGN